MRTCDGRYFPLPRSTAASRLDPVKVCNALCPAATTQVFTGSKPDTARAADGTRYADTDTAFTFRDKVVPGCSCTGNGPGGLAQIDIESDPTLRAGDVVVTKAGPTVFRGGAQLPHRSADFTPVGDYDRLNSAIRTKLSEMRVEQNGVAPQPTADLTRDAAAPRKPAARRAQRTNVQANALRGLDLSMSGSSYRAW